MTALAIVRCEHCGTALAELNYCELLEAWVCFGCLPKNHLRPIELSKPLEPARPLLAFNVVGSKNGSMGLGDGSMGVDETAARVKALGIEAPLGEQFDCILPGHEDSARVHSTARKHWLYRCEGEQRGLGLAEVRAAAAYGDVRRISPVEAARWKERLDYEAGLRQPRVVELNAVGSNATRRVLGGLRLFLGLRDERWDGQPFVWARPFVIAYCGVTDQQARDGVRELRNQGVLESTDERAGRAILWRLPAALTDDKRGANIGQRRMMAAPERCRCDKPLPAPDDDGELVCTRCGHAAGGRSA
jgi:hypothetical protein